MNVVVIEDDTALLRSLTVYLTGQGHQVRAFDDPIRACTSIADESPPDVLVIDYVLPNFTGKEVLERLKDFLPQSCKVIMISAYTDLVESNDLEASGVSAFLPKPFDLDRLKELVA